MLHVTGIFTYIWLMFMVNVGTYSIHGAYGQGEAQNGGKIERFREEGIVFFLFLFLLLLISLSNTGDIEW